MIYSHFIEFLQRKFINIIESIDFEIASEFLNVMDATFDKLHSIPSPLYPVYPHIQYIHIKVYLEFLTEIQTTFLLPFPNRKTKKYFLLSIR